MTLVWLLIFGSSLLALVPCILMVRSQSNRMALPVPIPPETIPAPLSGQGSFRTHGGAGFAGSPGGGGGWVTVSVIGAGGGGGGGSVILTNHHDLAVDPDVPDTLGWRGWAFDGEHLVSPSQQTKWLDAELHIPEWHESDVVRGVAGIHALRVPKDWKLADPGKYEIGAVPVHGIVERFGRFALGSEGWRAEWVIVRELATRDRETAEQLKKTYPDVIVHHIKTTTEVIQ